MADLTMSVEDRMLTLLELMARGEDMMTIGVWETPLKRLAMKEYAVKVGNGYRITETGKAYLAKSEGVAVEVVQTLQPVRPPWIVTELPDGGSSGSGSAGLVVLRKNEMTVSGYEALAARWVPVVHGETNEIDTLAIQGDPTGFLQAVMDMAWARGLRPSNEPPRAA